MNISSQNIQPGVRDKLVHIRQANRVGSAYLFSGPEGSGKEALAIEFAILLNCENPTETPCGSCPNCLRFKSLQHEHLKLIVPLPAGKPSKESNNVLQSLNPKTLEFLTNAIRQKAQDPFYKIEVPKATRILINSIRELRKSIYLKTQYPGQKVVLIFDAHLLSMGQGEAANALLKILEEPPENTTLILVTDFKSKILPTILSRCQQIDFPPVRNKVIQACLENRNVKPDQVDFITGIAQGNIQRAIALAGETAADILALINRQAQIVHSENSSGWRKFINDYSRMAFSNPAEFKQHLFLIQLWFRSAYRLRAGLSDILHTDLYEDLKSFNAVYPEADLLTIDSLLEQALGALGRNLYFPLVLTNLLIRIQSALRNRVVKN